MHRQKGRGAMCGVEERGENRLVGDEASLPQMLARRKK
jgi:hypothetical protein